jgi:8-oxo-dGTP pyrophosphatase MutT (NUDIX family)
MRGSDAERELRELMRRGVTLDFRPQGALAELPLRRSAVLILFGALDRVPARSPFPAVAPELDVLLTRRADRMRHHAGQIAFPGGGAEPGDSDSAMTALREASEETGLDPAGVEVLGALPDVHIPVSNNLVTPVVGWWRLPSPVAADHAESVEVYRVPVAELLAGGPHPPRRRLPSRSAARRAHRVGLHGDPARHALRRARLEPPVGRGADLRRAAVGIGSQGRAAWILRLASSRRMTK